MLLLVQHSLQAEDDILLQCLAQVHVSAMSHAINARSQCCNIQSAASTLLLISIFVCMKGLSGSNCRKRLCPAGQPEGGQQWEDRAEAGRDICHWCLSRSCDRLRHHPFGCRQDSSHDPRGEGPVQERCGLCPSDLQRGGLRCLSQGECILTPCLSCNLSGVYGWGAA